MKTGAIRPIEQNDYLIKELKKQKQKGKIMRKTKIKTNAIIPISVKTTFLSFCVI